MAIAEAGTMAAASKEAKERYTPRNPRDWLLKVARHPNVAKLLEPEELERIGQRVVREYEIDEASRKSWKDLNEEAMKLAEQLLEEGSDGQANVKYPVITIAAIQFAARALPEIIPGNELVKAKIVGEDPFGQKQERGERVSEHMSWQYLEEQEEWVEELDRLLMALPILGTYFRKSYFDSRLGRNASVAVSPEEVVVNMKARSLETAPRISHLCTYYEYEIYEFVKSGVWLDQPIRHVHLAAHEHPDEAEENIPHPIIEQHRRLDLDHDGYAEPYIVTVHKDTQKVVRIVARFDTEDVELERGTDKVIRIEPTHYFTKFGFLPNPRGGIYDIGFGLLLFPLNDACNALINQLIDAGTQANLQAGFLARGVRMQAGQLTFQQGEWKVVDTKSDDLRKSILPLPVNEPSDVLFKLLGLLLEAAKDISSVQDVMTGQEPTSANVPATTVLMLVEQGTKVFNSIYKRVHRSLKGEFKKGYKLNAKYLKPIQYFHVLDTQKAIKQEDYGLKDLDIVPVSDPTMATDVQRMAKAQAIMGVSGRPNVNEDAITLRYLRAINAPQPEEILPPPDKRQPKPPDPKTLEITGKLEIESKKLMLQMAEFRLKEIRTMAEIEKFRAHAIEHLAKAEAQEIGPQMQIYMEELRQMGAESRERIKAIAQLAGKAGQQQSGEGTATGGTGNV